MYILASNIPNGRLLGVAAMIQISGGLYKLVLTIRKNKDDNLIVKKWKYNLDANGLPSFLTVKAEDYDSSKLFGMPILVKNLGVTRPPKIDKKDRFWQNKYPYEWVHFVNIIFSKLSNVPHLNKHRRVIFRARVRVGVSIGVIFGIIFGIMV